jgi:branched-chain amino acid transport system ATP-binding protein
MAPLLELDGVSKSFGALRATDSLGLSVETGEVLAVIGPNGAGKSTLFTGDLAPDTSPDAGRIMFAGAEITRLAPLACSRLGIGRSYQIPRPFVNMTVFENLLVGAIFGARQSERESCDRCAEVLELTGLIDRANEPARRLTLLERKRLELARALTLRPKLLLLDEIAGGLSEPECHALVETIRAIHARGTTIVWIEHIVHALVSVASRLMVMNFGQRLDEGAPHAVMTDARVRGVYMGIPAS